MVGGQRHDSAVLPTGISPYTHCTRGRVGPGAGPELCGERKKFLHLLEFEPATIKHLSNRYKDCDTPVSGLNVAVINTVFVRSDCSSKVGIRYSFQNVL